MAEPCEDPLVGRLIAQRYRLISRLGEGGMAVVYLARHVLIDRLSAIKFLRGELSRFEAARDRFLREARAVNRINHPNIVEISDFGESDGLTYLVMEYVPGDALSQRIAARPIDWRRAASIGLQVAAALGRAHQMGVIHRDLKPSNILVVDRRRGRDLVKLTDFGVAKILAEHTVTQTDVALGTPGYVAPEYLEYGVIDARSDLFSLGVVLYEAVSGQLPFRLDQPQPFRRAPTPLTDLGAGVPKFFDEVVSTLLQVEPDDRPRDGFEAYDLLRRALGHASDAPELLEPEPLERARTQIGLDAPAPPPPSADHEAPDLPRLATTPVEHVAPKLVASWERLAHALGAVRPLAGQIERKLPEIEERVGMVRRLATMVGEETLALEAAQEQAAVEQGELGRKLDALARRRSKKLGWAGTIRERREVVRSQRDSGTMPVSTAEAMMWEHAALEHEEERVWSLVDQTTAEMDELHRRMEELSARQERSLIVETAKIEGRIAALRAMALEAWMLMKEVAAEADVRARW